MIYVNDSIDSFGRVIRIDDSLLTIYSFNLLGVNTVLFVDNIDDDIILSLAPKIAEYKIFNRKTDVIFVNIIPTVFTYYQVRAHRRHSKKAF